MLRGMVKAIGFGFGRIDRSLAVLGLTVPTTKIDIKKAYFKLVKEHHPDTEGGSSTDSTTTDNTPNKDNTAFVAIVEAYKHLNDLT